MAVSAPADQRREHDRDHPLPRRHLGQPNGPIFHDGLSSLATGSPFALFSRAVGRASSLNYGSCFALNRAHVGQARLEARDAKQPVTTYDTCDGDTVVERLPWRRGRADHQFLRAFLRAA